MQKMDLPLPALALGAVMLKCATDHRANPESIVVDKVEAGHGRHVCDARCEELARVYGRACMTWCEDSDWVVEMTYTARQVRFEDVLDEHGEWVDQVRHDDGPWFTAGAVYGVLDGQPSCWMD